MKIPSIKIKYDLDKETELFLSFLHHSFFPQHRSKIFRAFPELEILLQTTKNKNQEKLIIKKFIKEFRKKNAKKIKRIIIQSENLLKKKSKKALTELAKLMDYRWPKNHSGYIAMPTILPFSPLGNNIFYFSILGQIKGKDKKNALFIAIHEISHFIFYNILKEIERKIKKSTPDDLKNYLKEALTVVLLNQKPLSNILKLRDYKGNPEIQDLQVKKNGKIISFTEFINEYYQIIKVKNKKNFKVFLRKILDILLPISKEFSEKRIVWNRHGNQLYKKLSTLRLYQKPIKIKKG